MNQKEQLISELTKEPTAKELSEKQERELMFSELDSELKEKIRAKFLEIKIKYPSMKNSRAMRKAGEFYKVKFEFE